MYQSAKNTDNWLALCVAITFRREVSPEQCFRLLEGTIKFAPAPDITDELIERLDRILKNPLFRNWERLERAFKIDRFTIIKIVNDYRKRQDEKVLIIYGNYEQNQVKNQFCMQG